MMSSWQEDQLCKDAERLANEFAQYSKAAAQIAGAMTRLAEVAEKWYEKNYPDRVPRETTVSKIPDEIDRLVASIGGDGDVPIEKWLELEEEEVGPRERAVIQRKTK